jgi:hypothetical protein
MKSYVHRPEGITWEEALAEANARATMADPQSQPLWHDWGGPEWPDWRDAGRPVEMQDGDKTVAGTLFVDDFFFDGDGEVPAFMVRDADGAEHEFGGCDRFRYLDEE